MPFLSHIYCICQKIRFKYQILLFVLFFIHLKQKKVYFYLQVLILFCTFAPIKLYDFLIYDKKIL